MNQHPFAERLNRLKLFSLQLRRLTGRSTVEVYKVLKAVGQVNVYLHSINTRPPGTGTLKDISRRLKMEAVLLYTDFWRTSQTFCHGK